MMNTDVQSSKPPKDSIGAKKMFLWQSRSISIGCNMMVLGFLSIYCTDTLGIPAALVGTLLVLSKVFDGVTDLFAGYLVDKTNTKLGRGRPYEVSILGVWLCTILMFCTPPEFSMVAKCAWVFSMYIMCQSVFTTLLNADENVYMVRAFNNQEHYIAIRTYGSIVVMLFVVGFNISFPMLMARIATSPGGWRSLILLFGVPLAAIGLLRFLFIEEVHHVDVQAEGEKLKLKDVLMVLRRNPYIYIIAAVTVVYNLVTNMGINTYYFTYIVGDVGMMGPLAAIQLLLIPMMFAFPALIRKFTKKPLIIAGLLITAFGYAMNFFALDNIPALMAANVLISAGSVPISMLVSLMVIDCAEYNEYKKMHRLVFCNV